MSNNTIAALDFIAENIEGIQELLDNQTDTTEPPQNATLVPTPEMFVQSNWANSFNQLYNNNQEKQQILN